MTTLEIAGDCFTVAREMELINKVRTRCDRTKNKGAKDGGITYD